MVDCLSSFELVGRNKLEINLQNDNLLPKDYLFLKKVPNCKFCLAKGFNMNHRSLQQSVCLHFTWVHYDEIMKCMASIHLRFKDKCIA
ncbi:hypothetical protein H5410_008115 [Solanum commersonii]|uniref:Uncharacterized protein n=1 Tax=Solanum commersonii TaxID=4109 RepID=A0A9J6AER7_SOLCO|nr:hypothetical protein H5410_008115 [Solanum commersonii]